MASNTENLNLLMKNPSTDGADTFNIQTMLNENWQKIDENAGTVAQTLANILKPTTPPLIGLPSTTTPDGMFQALGNAGELHVWRKTVVIAQEIPAGYKLETISDLVIATRATNYAYGRINLSASTAISVDDNGGISLTSPTSVSNIDIKKTSSATTLNDNCRGKFCLFTSNETYPVDTVTEGVYYIPSTATFTVGVSGSNNVVTVDTAQKVVSWAKTPASTTTTYPVSTNPNAYQEGDDAKAAGYVVGDVETGTFVLGNNNSNPNTYHYGDSLAVSDDGVISVSSPSEALIDGQSSSLTTAKQMLGKFAQVISYYTGDFPIGQTYLIPSDATIQHVNSQITVNKRQPVTGYPAIPAGTTIEYLGKLGDKSRVQVVSYVGTGTYGESDPCSITADFKIKIAICLFTEWWYQSTSKWAEIPSDLTTSYKNEHGFAYAQLNRAWGKRSGDSKTITWYNSYSAPSQLNVSGTKYYFLLIG